MKKFLLLIVATLFVSAGYSNEAKVVQAWEQEIQAHATDVKMGAWKQIAPIAAVSDGVYVTGTFDQDITIGNELIQPVAKSAFLVKYTKESIPAWTVALKGAATINAISANDNGVVVAGVFADAVEVGSKDGKTVTINGMADNSKEVSAFILVYDKDGNLKASKTIVPELDEELVNSSMYFPEGGDTYFKPSQVQLDGDKIYLAARYSANNKISDALTLKGAVVNVFDFMYMDIASAAILSFDKNLQNAELVYNVQSAEEKSYLQMEPSSLAFTVDEGKLWAAGAGMGSLKVSGKTTETIEYSMDGMGTNENGMFIIDPSKGVKVFHAKPSVRSYIDNSIDYMKIMSGQLGIVGTYSDNLPFDTTKTEATSNAIFYVLYNTNTQAVTQAAVSQIEKQKNEVEVVTGASHLDNLYIAGFVQDKTSGAEKISKNLNLSVVDGQLEDTEFNMLITAMDYVTKGEYYMVEAEAGKYSVTFHEEKGSAPVNPEALWSDAIVAHEASVKFGAWKQNAPIAAVSDGVYVTGTFDQDMTIGNELIQPVAKSAFIAKYTKEGIPTWTVALKGAATINAISADDNGVVVAGVFADAVEVGSKDGKTVTINGMADNSKEVSAFILIYDKDGNLKASKTIVPELDEELVNSSMYFPEGGDTYFKPSQVQLDGDKIYLAARYSANNKISDALTLKGAVVNVFDFMYMDIASAAILSFDKNLQNAELVYNVQSAEEKSYNQMEPSSLAFTVAKGKLWAAGSGMGSLKVTGKTTETIEYSMDGMGTNENGMFIIDPSKGVKVFHAKPTDRSNIDNSIDFMNLKDGYLNMVGTFSDNLPFDTTKTEATSNATFFVAYDVDAQKVEDAAVSQIEKQKNETEIVSGVKYTDEGAEIYGYVYDSTSGSEKISSNLNLLASGNVMEKMKSDLFVTALDGHISEKTYMMSAEAGTYTISLYGTKDPTGVSTVTSNDKTNGKCYDLNGVEVSKDYKGIKVTGGRLVY